MPRPIKGRKVCCMPKSCKFGPLDSESTDSVTMTVDEYETIRLIDYLGCNQEECAKQMEVARTTVQGIYNQARKKIALSIVEGKTILINGGKYHIYGEGSGCGLNHTCMHRRCLGDEENKDKCCCGDAKGNCCGTK